MLVYTVDVTATDPSGATDTVTVTINVMAVNESPDITRAPADLDHDGDNHSGQ